MTRATTPKLPKRLISGMRPKKNHQGLEVRPRLPDHICTSSSFPTEPYGYVYDKSPVTPVRKQRGVLGIRPLGPPLFPLVASFYPIKPVQTEDSLTTRTENEGVPSDLSLIDLRSSPSPLTYLGSLHSTPSPEQAQARTPILYNRYESEMISSSPEGEVLQTALSSRHNLGVDPMIYLEESNSVTRQQAQDIAEELWVELQLLVRLHARIQARWNIMSKLASQK